MHDRLPARVPVLFATLALSSCQGKEALQQRCLAEDFSACESACGKHVYGEGGCFHAGQQYRARAGFDFSSADFRRAEDYFRKSCDGKFGDGCVLLAELIEGPFGGNDAERAGSELPKAMPDGSMHERERALDQGCSLGSIMACKRLGDVLIGKDASRAKAAYDKSCGASTDATACRNARANEVSQAEKWHAACSRGVADDCSRLGNLLYAVDVPRAIRLFVSECELPGVAAVTGGVDGFVRLRAGEASRGIVTGERPSLPKASGPLPTLTILPPTVTGGVPVAEVDRAFQQLGEELRSCAAIGKPQIGALELSLTVDRTGDAFRAAVTRTDLSPAASDCAKSLVDALAFAPPTGGLADVEVKLRFGSAEPSGMGKRL